MIHIIEAKLKKTGLNAGVIKPSSHNLDNLSLRGNKQLWIHSGGYCASASGIPKLLPLIRDPGVVTWRHCLFSGNFPLLVRKTVFIWGACAEINGRFCKMQTGNRIKPYPLTGPWMLISGHLFSPTCIKHLLTVIDEQSPITTCLSCQGRTMSAVIDQPYQKSPVFRMPLLLNQTVGHACRN